MSRAKPSQSIDSDEVAHTFSQADHLATAIKGVCKLELHDGRSLQPVVSMRTHQRNLMTVIATDEHTMARTVREAMTRNVHHARLTDTVSRVGRYMAELFQPRMVVVDERKRVAGIVSQSEVLKFYMIYLDEVDFDITAAREAAASQSIALLLSDEKPLSIRHDALLSEAVMCMGRNHVDCLPVVDRYQELKGILTLTEVLREFTLNETSGMETGFEFLHSSAQQIKPRPAFIRKATKEIAIPREQVSSEHDLVDRVMLGFDPASGRVLVKFIQAGVRLDGSSRLRRTDEHVVINAEAFVDHYRLLDRPTIFDAQPADDARYLVLMPR